jgi:excisionase family DNA binding protein
MAEQKKKLTPAEVAELWGVAASTVIGWIKSGRLRAVNVSKNASSQRPRYRIDSADLADFERLRQVGAPEPAPSRRKKTPGLIERY